MPHLSCGIVGLPNVGKSTLFNALTQAGAAVAPYPFCTIDPNAGVVPVQDPRVDRLAELVHVGKKIYHTVEYVDVAGLVRDASKGAGRGNQFLEHIRNCDALIHVVRCFVDENVAHVDGALDPLRDVRTVNTELLLADLDVAQRALDRTGKLARHDPAVRAAAEMLEKLCAHLDGEQPARTFTCHDDQRSALRELRLLTAKPVLYAGNIDEKDLPGEQADAIQALARFAQAEGSRVVPICAKIEDELAALAPEEAALFREDAGLKEPGLQRLVRATAELLDLISFLTFNESEVRAWTIRRGATAVEAAGVIHTDFARHFIRAEVTAFADFEKFGGEKGAREHGVLRTEGRDYVVRDGEVIYFRIGP